jgi:hypothetical protein
MLKMSDKRTEALAELCRNMGQVFLATMILEPIIANAIRWDIIISGSILVVASFYFGIAFADYKPSAIIKS